MTSERAFEATSEGRRAALDAQFPPLVLASASPRRRELLTALGLAFAVEPADVDETITPGEAAGEAAARLARSKAAAVAARRPNAFVLGSDTVVALADRILGKPRDAAEATAMLRSLRGRAHDVITAVALVAPSTTDQQPARVVTTAVQMRDYTDAEIVASVAAGTPFDKAGAYAIQDDAFAPVTSITGCYCNVVGLPLWAVLQMLRLSSYAEPILSPDTRRAVCQTCPLQ